MFKEIKYAGKRKEIRQLLYKRLALKNKIRYSKLQLLKFEKELPLVEKDLNKLLRQAGNKI